MKIAINKCYGGFGLSDAAAIKCIERGMTCKNAKTEQDDSDFDTCDFHYHSSKIFDQHYYINDCRNIEFRTNSILIGVIEEMGDEASGEYGDVKIIDLPDNVTTDDIQIEEYDGQEWIAEKHRMWS